ncbi:MAG: TonB family protein [Saprospiraceae bacterium]
MKKEKKDESFLKQPYFEGGDGALKDFIARNLQYPTQALEHRIEGSIPITYDINYKGVVTDVKLLHHIGYGCDEEAIRIVKMLKFIVPKVPRHMKVIFHKKMTIHFRLPEIQDVFQTPPPISFQYTVTSTTQTVKKPQPNSYNYTINLEGN